MTINEAKQLYYKYDCSLFGMARDDDAYEDYVAMKIPKTIEIKWSQELFLNLWKQLKVTGDFHLFNRMEKLTERFRNKDSLDILIEALNYIKYSNIENKLCISETLLGRSAITVRSGMIFYAYDLGEKELAKELLQSAIKLINNETNDERIIFRINRNIKTSIVIDTELNLGIYDSTIN